ncbi:O-antigen ligase family protein [Caldovatus sediminis]|nr:O-antigen ligase family protein [Caldovatus sediminis]
MRSVPSTLRPWLLILPVGAALLGAAIAAPEITIRLVPLLILIPAALLLYEYPLAFAVLLVATYGLGVDFELARMASSAVRDGTEEAAASGASEGLGALGAAVVKVMPFVLAAMLTVRYGFASAVNWPFLAFAAIAATSIVVLPMGRVVDLPEMVRSFLGSTAPFVLAFAAAPRRLWSLLCKGVVAVPLVSAAVGVLYDLIGPHFAVDPIYGRFQGMHSAPFLAGFVVTAIFACTLEYLRGFRPIWLVLGAANLLVLFATQARAPTTTVALFLLLVFIAARDRIFPLRRKADLVMGGMLPGLIVLGPAFLYALDRFIGSDGEFNYSGRDVIWPYFVDAIEARPLFGYGLGAGKLIVDPDDPQIRLIRSNAAHNEYLRLAVDAGVVGCAAIFAGIVAWIWGGTRRTARTERVVLRCALVAALFHAAFDNVLIATTGVVQFIWFTAAMARSRLEVRTAPGAAPLPSRPRRGAPAAAGGGGGRRGAA